MQAIDFQSNPKRSKSSRDSSNNESQTSPLFGVQRVVGDVPDFENPRLGSLRPRLGDWAHSGRNVEAHGSFWHSAPNVESWFSTRRNLEAKDQSTPFGAASLFVEIRLIRSYLSNGDVKRARLRTVQALKAHPNSERLTRILEILSPGPTKRTNEVYPSRNSELTWLKENRSAYNGLWVAVDGENLVASSTSLRELLQELEQTHTDKSPLIHKVV